MRASSSFSFCASAATPPDQKQLVVTADDFGAATEVNEAVECAHRHGILTAASLMVAAPAARDAVRRAKAMPSLRTGLHIVLVEGRPILPPSIIPDLVGRNGLFRADMARAGAAMFFSKSVRRQMEDEIAAQFSAFHATGLPLDHVNAHKHFHLHPSIADAVLEIGRTYGMRALRVPLEPGRVLARTGHKRRNDSVSFITAPFARHLGTRFRKAGVRVPDAVFGLAWSGAMHQARLKAIIDHLPAGLSEIYLHPATSGGFEGSAPGYRYADEFAALIDPAVVSAARNPHIALGGFSDFL
ncbi:MAG TPA: hopanoid biosynthesis-associated protein HpnK [Rhizomicrobium sp.]